MSRDGGVKGPELPSSGLADEMIPLLAPVIAEFTALYPEVSLSMTMSDRMVDLVEEGFDLAIRLLPVPDSSLILRRVGTYATHASRSRPP